MSTFAYQPATAVIMRFNSQYISTASVLIPNRLSLYLMTTGFFADCCSLVAQENYLVQRSYCNVELTFCKQDGTKMLQLVNFLLPVCRSCMYILKKEKFKKHCD